MAEDDDGSIADDAWLLRRIHPKQVIEDKNQNGFRVSSGAFDAKLLSVDAEPLLQANGLNWNFCLKDTPGYSLARITAGLARSKALPVVHNPIDGNPAHCEIRGNKSPAIAKGLAAAAQWVHREPKAA